MTSPYILPPGNVQIAFSGGRTSAYMLHHILEANGGLPEPAQCQSCMTVDVCARAFVTHFVTNKFIQYDSAAQSI